MAKQATSASISWDHLISEFQEEDQIKKALRIVRKTKDELDISPLRRELKNYLIYSTKKKADARRISPETLETALEILHECENYKDRAGTIWLDAYIAHSDLDELYDVCSKYLSLKKDIQELRSDTQRKAAVDSVLARLVRRMSKLKSLLEMCEYVTKSLMQTYQIISNQIKILEMIIYRRPSADRFGSKEIEDGKSHKKFTREL